MPAPRTPPIGLRLSAAARTVSRAFDDALAEAGGSLPMWLVLLNVKARQRSTNQRELAAAVGIREATLTHHLNAMEADGLLTRRRDPGNRRVHVVELTAEGEAAFARLRDAAVGFDRRLRRGIPAAELDGLGRLLDRLAANVTAPNVTAPNVTAPNMTAPNMTAPNMTAPNVAGGGADQARATRRGGRD